MVSHLQNDNVLQSLGHGSTHYLRQITGQDGGDAVPEEEDGIWVHQLPLLASVPCDNHVENKLDVRRGPYLDNAAPAGHQTEDFPPTKIK